jgi:hypothetical protein
MHTRRSRLAPLLIAILPPVVLATYIAAYFQLGTVSSLGPAIVRTYHGQLQADLFTPPAIIESWMRGRTVHVAHI